MTIEAIPEVTVIPSSSSSEPWPHPRQAWYAIFVFALALMINFLDRGIITLLVPAIKADLRLTDFQLSMVMGFAFVIFYLFVGLPIARYADVGPRRTIVGIGIALWSAATALCGLAANFWQLFLFRVGTGVGEACNGPATFSMISDLFPREKLPRAIAVLNFGFMAGTGFALIIGGAVIHILASMPPIEAPILGIVKSWQMAFILVGLPGLLVAALMFTVKEPIRRGRLIAGAPAGSRPASVPIRDVVKFVADNRDTYGPMFLGLAFNTVLAFGASAWGPAFYGRTYGWSMTRVGLVAGCVILIVWPFGAMFGSWLAERWQRQGHDDANMRVVICAILLLLPGQVLLPLMPRPEYAVAISALNGFIAAWVLGPQNAAIQTVTPNEMRGQITALFLFIFNVVGFGLGPMIVALFTDYVFGSEADLRYSLSLVAAVLGPLAALSIWSGLKAYGRSVARAKSWT
ncbi:MAG: spinster family MFS transporter [Rhizomicrobium sp.]